MSFRIVPLIKGSAPVIVLERPVILVGRHLECDVQISSSKISRRHCCLAIAYDRVLIRDLGSRNGVRVNGRVVDESRLYDGDELAIGPIIFRLEALGDNRQTIGVPASQAVPPPPRTAEKNPETIGVPASRPAPPLPRTAQPAPSARAVRPAVPARPPLSGPESDIDLVPLDDV